MPDDLPSFADLLSELSAGDQDAARRVYEHFVRAVVGVAAQKLNRNLGPLADPESVAQSVFLTFFVRQRRGEYDLRNWGMVFGLLAHITFRKCLNRNRHLLAQKRSAAGTVSLADWEPATVGPGPEEEAALNELLRKAFAGFDADDRTMIELTLDGGSTESVARTVGLSTRTVQRTLEEFRRRLETLLTIEE